MSRSWLFILIFSICSFVTIGAQTVLATNDSIDVAEPVDTDYVYLLNADIIRFEEYINPDAQRLIGNVVFRHDSMFMYCDSALFYQERNSFNAYHNVRVEQGDTLFMYGDSLFYDSDSRLLRVRDNVRLENKTMILLKIGRAHV